MMKKHKKGICPHCGKEIKLRPIVKKIHYKKSPCGCCTDNCPLTDDKEKVTCLNCIGRIRDLEDGFLVECPKCGFIYESWEFTHINFCKECGIKLKEKGIK